MGVLRPSAPLLLFGLRSSGPGSGPLSRQVAFLGPIFFRSLFWLARRSVRSWMEPWHRLRAEIGLPPTNDNPLFQGHSPLLVLALFSSLFAARQPDWPSQTVITGFPVFDGGDGTTLPADLETFSKAGPPPVVFTLGSSAVLDAGQFYGESATAAKKLGRRAVLLVGPDVRNRMASLPEGVVACEYAPYSALFPRAAAIVHHGGIGTTAQALRRAVRCWLYLLPMTSPTTPSDWSGWGWHAPFLAPVIPLVVLLKNWGGSSKNPLIRSGRQKSGSVCAGRTGFGLPAMPSRRS